jgi:hypothetical protein
MLLSSIVSVVVIAGWVEAGLPWVSESSPAAGEDDPDDADRVPATAEKTLGPRNGGPFGLKDYSSPGGAKR